VIIEGHGDERGSREYNLALGERRALAIRDYLISLGVDPSIIQTKSLGEEMPAATGHDESAWRMNRRGVFAIY
jgi:peptidoglycan-associated lipoprotein